MTIQVDRKQNCNHCIYRQDVSRHWDLEDYCLLNMKKTSRITVDRDCPIGEEGNIRCS